MQLSKEFKARCSGIGQIMTSPKTKGELLSKTCLTHVHEWIKSQPEFYGKHINFKSKYTTKGNFCETPSIKYAASQLGWGLVEKNETEFENSFLTGTPDIILSKSVEDIKNSWSQTTFPLFANDIPIDGYGWQLQGYCELTDKPQGGLVYTLMDAPEFLVTREARSRMYELGLDELDAELYDEVLEEMTYSNFPDELRIKRFFVDRDKEQIEKVSDRVDVIRNYINSL